MTFTGHENHDITLATASAWTANFRNSDPTPGKTIAHAFGKDAISAILNQAGCVGVRFYYAIKDNGEKQLVVVGVNADGDDLYQGLLADRSFNCPSDCSSVNPLNSTM